MGVSAVEKAARFRALHADPGVVLLGSAWDAGSARLLQHLGYAALETSSAGLAFSTGRPDATGLLTRREILDNAAQVAASVDLPVTADLENGFGDTPEMVGTTIRLAAARGIIGGSIEDATGEPNGPKLFSLEDAQERVRSATAAASSCPFHFILTARCDAFMHGVRDLDEVIRRLVAYQEAGADVLAAPGLPDRAAVRKVVAALSRPVALFIGLSDWQPDMQEVASLGVKRVSVGSGLARVAWTAVMEAARSLREGGTAGAIATARPFSELNVLFKDLAAKQ